ncbi:MAG: DUF2652 domain-containing protein [Bacteroidota bacterium]
MAIIVEQTRHKFELAEVEGDALFLYQDVNKLDINTIYQVVENTYIAFHKHLAYYNEMRICTCGACTSAINLSLKFIAHIGVVEFASVNGKEKPYGLDVITAHRLMKNNIEGKDYLLFSDSLSSRFDLEQIPKPRKHGSASYDEIGEVNYSYLRLLDLKESIKPEENNSHLANNSLPTIVAETGEIDAPIDIVYEVLSDFKHRPVWNNEAKIVDHNEKDIYRLGSEHYCIINNKKFKVRTIGSKKSKHEFGEQVLNNGPFKEINLYFVFNKDTKGTNHTILTIEIRAKFYPLIKPFVLLIMKPTLKKKVPEMFRLIKELSEKINAERLTETDHLEIL